MGSFCNSGRYHDNTISSIKNVTTQSNCKQYSFCKSVDNNGYNYIKIVDKEYDRFIDLLRHLNGIVHNKKDDGEVIIVIPK